MFAVIKWTHENTIGVVPTSWLVTLNRVDGVDEIYETDEIAEVVGLRERSGISNKSGWRRQD